MSLRSIVSHKRVNIVVLIVMMFTITSAHWPSDKTSNKAHAAGPDMMLLWDGGAAPTGWQFSTVADGKFPRGDTVANYGTTGGAATETPGVTFALNSLSAQSSTGGVITSARSSSTHTHTFTGGSIASASTLPAFRSLKLIVPTSTPSVPSTIPAGAIAYFDSSPGIPAGTDWTRYSAEDSKMIEINNSSAAGAITTGGSDTHNHAITWPALAAAAGTVNIGTLGGNVASTGTHTHTAPAGTNSDTQSNTPAHIIMVMAQANVNTPVPPGMITMFDNDPGAGWSLLSGTGGVLNQRFVRGGSTYTGSTVGSDTHTHAVATSGNTGAGDTTSGNGAGTGSAAQAHTHTLKATFVSSSNIPPYFSVIYYKKIAFDLTNYRFYNDSGVEAVTDPWGNPDIAQNTQINQLPATNVAPSNNTILRLRANFTVLGTALPISTIKFKLQWKQGTDGSCTTGSWTDVGTGVWTYATSTITDGTTLSTSVLSPTSTDKQNYIKTTNSSVNPVAGAIGDTMEYDFHIQDSGATDNSMYSFRAIQVNNSELFYSYTQCPTVMTAPGSSDLMRHGNYFYNQVEQGFYWAN